MLYDPKWGQTTKADPLTLPPLTAWLETKNPRQKYDYWSCDGRCLFSLYLVALGYEPGTKPEHASREIWMNLHSSDFSEVATQEPYTFGAALKRARTLSSPNHTK